MRTCPACNLGIHPNDLVCPHCGISLNPDAPAQAPHSGSGVGSLVGLVLTGIIGLALLFLFVGWFLFRAVAVPVAAPAATPVAVPVAIEAEEVPAVAVPEKPAAEATAEPP